jgi:hypothetical protein
VKIPHRSPHRDARCAELLDQGRLARQFTARLVFSRKNIAMQCIEDLLVLGADVGWRFDNITSL